VQASRWVPSLGVALVVSGGALILAALVSGPSGPSAEPLIPTAAPAGYTSAPRTASADALAVECAHRLTSLAVGAAGGASDEAYLWQGRPRWGVGVAGGPIMRYETERLRLGWYVDWQAAAHPARPGGVEYVQMVRLGGGVLSPGEEGIALITESNPGSTWLVGNEPDVQWQDNVEPSTYALLYHQVYSIVKHADPTAEVAAGSVSQPTPLRMRYLDAVLAAYEAEYGVAMPADAWSVHGFILREQRDSWGVGIPPGLPDSEGVLYEVDDCDDPDAFRQQIIDFRRWMAERGYRDYPLLVTEYGIPMPEDYGFPPERVARFLRETFAFFVEAVDADLGYPDDGNRLVQRWCWYSLDDTMYPTGRLLDPETRQPTQIGEIWERCLREVLGE
jgi:hypothetical protein